MWKQGLCGCDLVEELEKELSQIIRLGPKGIHRHPYEREAERDLTQTEKGKVIEDGGRDQSDVDTSQGMLSATRRQKRQRTDFSQEPLEGITIPIQTLEGQEDKQ